MQRIADSLPRAVELWLGGRDAHNVALKLGGSRFLVLEEAGEVEANIRRLHEIEPVSQS